MLLEQQGRQMSETMKVGALLALAGGFMDAYTYLLHGGVFANAQTGNIVLLGMYAAQGELTQAVHYLLPIAAFAAGVVLTEAVKLKYQNLEAMHWRQLMLLGEVALLFVCGFAPAGQWDTAVNITVSFVCSLQVSTFRKIRGCACATTMCTGNLRSGTELLCRWLMKGERDKIEKALCYFVLIFFFVLGAALGVWCIGWMQAQALWLCCVLGLGAVALMFRQQETDARQSLDAKQKGIPKG